MKTNIIETKANGKPSWMVDYRIEGKRVRKFFPSPEAAEAYAKTLEKEDTKFGQQWVGMDLSQRRAIALAEAEAAKIGLTLPEVVANYLKLLEKAPAPKAQTEVTLKVAIASYIKALEADRNQHARDNNRYVRAMEYYLLQFAANREAMRVSELTPDVFAEWFETRAALASDTLKGEKTRLVQFCKWAIKQGYLPEGNVACPTPVSPVKLKGKTKGNIRIVWPNEGRALLTLTAKECPNALVFLTLALFCGVRPEEVERVTFGLIDREHQEIVLDANHTKTRWARVAYIPPCAVQWLNLAERLGHWGPADQICCPSGSALDNLRTRKWVDLISEGWQQDILRHSTASFRLEMLNGDWDQVGKELGNKEAVLRDRYVRPVQRRVAEEFYGIVPTATLEAEAKAANADSTERNAQAMAKGRALGVAKMKARREALKAMAA